MNEELMKLYEQKGDLVTKLEILQAQSQPISTKLNQINKQIIDILNSKKESKCEESSAS